MQRPKRKENEDDLLKFQNEFLNKQTSPSAKVQRVAKDAGDTSFRGNVGNEKLTSSNDDSSRIRISPNDSSASAVLTDIKEHRSMIPEAMRQSKFQGGFPTVPRLKDFKSEQAKSPGKKPSLFARQFLSQKPSAFGLKEESFLSSKTVQCHSIDVKHDSKPKDVHNAIEKVNQPHLVTGQGLSAGSQAEKEQNDIHCENIARLSQMTQEEILAEKAKLESSIDPSILKFIQSQRNKPSGTSSLISPNERNLSQDKDVGCVKMDQNDSKSDPSFNPYEEFKIDKDLPGMGIVEDEKLEWMKDTAKGFSKDDKESHSVRFDFEGKLIAKDSNMPVNQGLHHHGEDAMAPGYTLEELFKLARSNFLQQRVFALKVLAKIMEQCQQGNFIHKIQGCLLERLIDAGLPFLLRWSLDDSTDAVYSAAIYAFYGMLCNPIDQSILDELMFVSDGFQIQCLKPPNAERDIKKLKAEKKGKLSDPEMISIDLIKGLIQMQLLPRLRYILEVCQPDQINSNYCMDVLVRVALHSLESSCKILECPRMIETIFTTLLPITWSSDGTAFPCYKALRLVRFLCIAGKSLAKKLWRDYDLCTRILRYASLINGDNFPTSDEEKLAVESIHIWRICLHHGVANATTIDVHSLVISLIQKYAITTKEDNAGIRTSVVLLAESIVRATLHGQQEKFKDSSKKVYFEDEKGETVCKIGWEMVSGLHIMLLKSMFVELEVLKSDAKEIPDLRFLSSLMSYLSSYAESAYKKTSVAKLDLLNEAASWMEEVILVVMASEVFMNIVNQISHYSDFLRPLDSLQNFEAPDCLPNHGMTAFKGGSQILEDKFGFVFLKSFVKLLHTTAAVNKHCSQKMLPFLEIKSLADYCANISSSSSSAHKISTTAVSSAIERQLLYHFLSLFEITSSLYNKESHVSPLSQDFFSTAFKLLTLFQPGEEIQAHDIMTKLIFNSKMYPASTYSKDILTKLQNLQISTPSEIPRCMENLLANAMANLGPIHDVYVKYCLPAMNSSRELDGNVIDTMTAGAVKSIEMNLLFLLILEMNKPEVLQSIPDSAKLVRIFCVFLIGSDAFFDSNVQQLLEALASIYASRGTLETLDLSISFPGISSFYDLFCDVLLQFSSTSFGNHIFSNYILIPLQQRYDVKYRKAIWGEYCDALRCFTMPVKSVILNLGNFLHDVEQDEDLLQLYLKNIISGNITPSRCPFLYLLAVHHLSNYIFNDRHIKDYSEVKVTQSSLRLLNLVIGMKNEDARSDIVMYDTLDLTLPKGFSTFRTLPPVRQLIIEKRLEALR